MAGLGILIAIDPAVSALLKEPLMGARQQVDDADHYSWLGGPVRRFLCGLGGHELMRSYSPGRISLRCTSCPYETPGWVIKGQRAEGRGLRADGRGLSAETTLSPQPSAFSPA